MPDSVPDSLALACLVLAPSLYWCAARLWPAGLPALAEAVRRDRGESFDLGIAVALAAALSGAFVAIGLGGCPVALVQGVTLGGIGLAVARVRARDASKGPA